MVEDPTIFPAYPDRKLLFAKASNPLMVIDMVPKSSSDSATSLIKSIIIVGERETLVALSCGYENTMIGGRESSVVKA